jgi:hypothetical protein
LKEKDIKTKRNVILENRRKIECYAEGKEQGNIDKKKKTPKKRQTK